ncbi:hypothetical protein Tco_1336963 [Tanacetum coccineum]
MDITKDDQISLDDALVAPADRLKIGKCNLLLSLDVASKESTLQVVYDVLNLTPFYKAFQVSADVPEIYMQEFWASAYIHNRSVRFKMNNKKHIPLIYINSDTNFKFAPKVGNEKKPPTVPKEKKGKKSGKGKQKAKELSEDIVCEDFGRYQAWSLLQETPIHLLEMVNCATPSDIGIYPLRCLMRSCKKFWNYTQGKDCVKVEAILKSAWTEKDQIDNFLKEKRFNTTAGNPVKKILLKLNLSDHRLFKDGGGVNESQERRSIKVFQDNHSRKMLKITMSNTSSRNKLNPEINDHYNILTGECQKDELKTKDKALLHVSSNEMIKNNLTVDKMQVNVQFLQQLQPEWSRFVTIVKQQHKLDEVSYHKFFDILKQYKKEVNKLHAERIAKNANPLALVATAQPHQDPYYQTSKSHKSYAPTSRTSLPTRSNATTRHKGKEIAKPIIPPFESASEEDSDLEQAQKDKEM